MSASIEYTPEQRAFMQEAIDLSRSSVKIGGGPFGAVVVKDGAIVGRGHNRVTLDNDPTAHAEVMAIRDASKNLETFELTDCELYTSCEPCPMCLTAAFWSRVKAIYYANDQHDADKIGFDDNNFYNELQKKHEERIIPAFHMADTNAIAAFEDWKEKCDKTHY